MNVLNIEHVSKIFGEKCIFDDVSYGIHEGDKIGIIGINGTGKTTLLKIIAGIEEPDEGQIIKQNGLRITYLPQNPEFPEGATVLSYVIDGKHQLEWNTESEAKTVLNKLDIKDHDAKIETLSGGQKKRVALARTLINPADVLILDEPTNHLDIASREWVEAAIEEFEGVLLFVSHDRYFIEKFAERIWLLEDGAIRDFKCGYSKYRSTLEHENLAKSQVVFEPRPKKEKPKGGTKETEKIIRRLEREIEKQEMLIAELDSSIEAAAADYQELTRLLTEKEAAETVLLELMEQWESAQV